MVRAVKERRMLGYHLSFLFFPVTPPWPALSFRDPPRKLLRPSAAASQVLFLPEVEDGSTSAGGVEVSFGSLGRRLRGAQEEFDYSQAGQVGGELSNDWVTGKPLALQRPCARVTHTFVKCVVVLGGLGGDGDGAGQGAAGAFFFFWVCASNSLIPGVRHGRRFRSFQGFGGRRQASSRPWEVEIKKAWQLHAAARREILAPRKVWTSSGKAPSFQRLPHTLTL